MEDRRLDLLECLDGDLTLVDFVDDRLRVRKVWLFLRGDSFLLLLLDSTGNSPLSLLVLVVLVVVEVPPDGEFWGLLAAAWSSCDDPSILFSSSSFSPKVDKSPKSIPVSYTHLTLPTKA